MLSLFTLVLAVAMSGACNRAVPSRAKHARTVMGTLAEVTADAANRTTADRAVQAAYARLDDVNRLMSDYVDNSEVGRLNALRAGQGLVVSPETFTCLQSAVEIAQESGGAFDVTCRPLVQLWKKAGKDNRLPTEEAMRQTMARVGWQKLWLEPMTRTVTPTVDGIQIDLGGIAKGYALDLAAEAMSKAGATGGLVNVGGDVVAVGTQANGQPWRVGVQHPFEKDQLYCTLALADAAVATSGVQQRFNVIDGKRYSHIVDPRTGWPAEQSPSVTVIGPDGMTADAWATVFSVLSVTEGLALLEERRPPGLEVLWITREGDTVVETKTEGFNRYVVE